MSYERIRVNIQHCIHSLFSLMHRNKRSRVYWLRSQLLLICLALAKIRASFLDDSNCLKNDSITAIVSQLLVVFSYAPLGLLLFWPIIVSCFTAFFLQ